MLVAIGSNPGLELDHGSDGSAIHKHMLDLLLAQPRSHDHSRRNLTSLEVVGRVSEYLQSASAWFPSLAQLCLAAGVSERRLRTAFLDCYDMPPSQYLRVRALSAVRQELRHSDPREASVTDIAFAHGFRHLGQFAHYYRRAYGVKPSQTLRAIHRDG